MPIVIKRYQNRKLYNTQSKRYVNLEQIEKLIKEQAEVRVIDNSSGEDITAPTLSQIIFEGEKNQSGFLPVSLLSSLVQSRGARIEELRRNIFETLHLAHHYDVEIEHRVSLLIEQGEISIEDGARLLQKMLSVNSHRDEIAESIEGRITAFLQQHQIPNKSDLSALMQKIDSLSMKVEKLKNETDKSGG